MHILAGLSAFVLLFALIAFIAGLIRPRLFSKLFGPEPTRKKVALTFGLVSLIAFIGVGIGAPELQKPTDTQPVAQASSTPVASNKVPAAPSATATTPVAGTSVPSPVQATAPSQEPATPKPSSGMTDAEYISGLRVSVIPFITTIGNAETNVGTDLQYSDMQSAASDAADLQSQVTQMRSGLSTLQPPPTDMVQINNLLEKMVSSLTKATNLTIQGVKNQDVSAVNDATAYFAQASEYGAQAVAAVQQWKASYNGG